MRLQLSSERATYHVVQFGWLSSNVGVDGRTSHAAPDPKTEERRARVEIENFMVNLRLEYL